MSNATGIDKTIAVVNWLFKKLESIFPAFKHAWATNEDLKNAKQTWLEAFILSEINSIEQLQRGLNKCLMLEKPFVPSPGQFIAWCRNTMQFITTDEAYNAAYKLMRGDEIPYIDNQFLVIHYAIQACGQHFLQNNTRAATFPVFERNYQIAIRDCLAGKLKEIPKALKDETNNQSFDKAKADIARDKAMAEIRKKLNLNSKRNVIV